MAKKNPLNLCETKAKDAKTWNWIPLTVGMICLILIFVGIYLYSPQKSPDIRILSGGEKWVNSTQGTLLFVATDNSGGDMTCDIELNTWIVSTLNVTSGVQAEVDLTLIAGENNIRVKATDEAGNSAWSNTYTVHVDVDPPDVVIIDFQESQ